MIGSRPPVTAAFVATRLAACSLAWGSGFLFIKLMHGEVEPIILASCRGMLGAVTIGLWLWTLGQGPWPKRGEIVPWLILGTLSGWIPNILVAFALQRMDSGPAALIQASGPLITAIGSHMLFAEERLTPRRIAGVVIGIIGVGFLIGPRALEGGATSLGILAMFGVAMGYASTNIYTRTIKNADPARLAFGQQAVSGIVATVLAMVIAGPAAYAPAGNHIWANLALGILATALPMAIFMNLIRAAGPTRAGMTGYTVPAVATLIGVVVLGERLTSWQMLGGLIVLLGVALVTTAKARQP